MLHRSCTVEVKRDRKYGVRIEPIPHIFGKFLTELGKSYYIEI